MFEGTRYDRSLFARLSGQGFRYGKAISKDEDEETIIEFIRTSTTKKPGDVVLMPHRKSMPSIPAKCRNYVLVKEKKKERRSLSNVEHEMVKGRLQDLTSA